MIRRASLLVLAAAVVLPLPAAGAAAAIPTAKLALMPLPLSAYGAESSSFVLDRSESGVVDNAEAAEATTDADDTAAGLKALGRISGFEVWFGNFSLLTRPGRLVYIGSDVELFRDGRSGAGGYTRSVREEIEDDPSSGVKLVSINSFPVRGIGDQATGAWGKLRLGSATVWVTGVQFRVGQLVASVSLMRTDDSSQRETTLALARKLATRIDGVLDGRVTTLPAKLPAKQAPKPVVKPTVEIAPAAIASRDLNGAKVVRQEYIADTSVVVAYEREFGTFVYGRSRLLTADATVSLERSATRAATIMDGIRVVLDPKRDALKKLLQEEFSKTAGFAVNDLTVLRQRGFTIGSDRAYDVAVRLRTPIGRMDAAYVFIVSGRFFATFSVVSTPGTQLSLADVDRMSKAFDLRMRAAAKLLAHVA